MKPFVILGASKTGTSTAVAATNTHPSVFCLFESDFSRDPGHGRNRDLCAVLPAAAALYGQGHPFADCLTRIHSLLEANGWAFERVGTKVQGIRPDLVPRLGDVPVLFMVRDVRLWAVKNRVLRDVMAAHAATDIVPHITAYARYYLDSFLIERCLRLPFDRVISRDIGMLPNALAELLGLPPAGFEKWWQQAGIWKQTAPKNYCAWVEGHASAFMQPLLADTRSRLAHHPFWTHFLPVFDKYFLAPEKKHSRAEVLRDQFALDEIARTHTMRLDEGFEQFESFKIMHVSTRDDGKLKIEATDRVTRTDIDQAAARWQIKPPEQGST
jgi:hypothetical protein